MHLAIIIRNAKTCTTYDWYSRTLKASKGGGGRVVGGGVVEVFL